MVHLVSSHRITEPAVLRPIYCDASLLVAEKPAGLLSVPGRGTDKQDCFSTRLQQYYPDVMVVHRLDMATSGLMLFARNPEMQRTLSRMFHDRKIDKIYHAVVAGQLETEGEIALPLLADWPNRPRQKIDPVSGKSALTRYRPQGYVPGSDTSQVILEPVTGRTHQLRVHLAAIGHPILGDALYGGRPCNRMLLHAGELSFTHPITNAPLTLRSRPAWDYATLASGSQAIGLPASPRAWG